MTKFFRDFLIQLNLIEHKDLVICHIKPVKTGLLNLIKVPVLVRNVSHTSETPSIL